MASPYHHSPHLPIVPNPTPLATYERPGNKLTRPPIQNPFDKFNQNEFESWIGGITSALRRALGQEEEAQKDTGAPKAAEKPSEEQAFGLKDVDMGLDQEDDSVLEDSFADFKARRFAKGKARDPREGPGLGGEGWRKEEPIELLSDEEEEEADDILSANRSEQGEEGEEDVEHELLDEQELGQEDEYPNLSSRTPWQQPPDDREIYELEDDDESPRSSPPPHWQRASQVEGAHDLEYEDEHQEQYEREYLGELSAEEQASGEEDDGEEELQTELGANEFVDDDYEGSDEDREGQMGSSPPVEIEDEDDEIIEISDTSSRSGLQLSQSPMLQYPSEDDIDEVQPTTLDTSFPPHQDSILDKQEFTIRDPWEGPQAYAQDLYTGGDRGIVHGKHLSSDLPDGELSVSDLASDTEQESFPPAQDDVNEVDIPDVWEGPRTLAEDFYAGGDFHGGELELRDAHRLEDDRDMHYSLWLDATNRGFESNADADVVASNRGDTDVMNGVDEFSGSAGVSLLEEDTQNSVHEVSVPQEAFRDKDVIDAEHTEEIEGVDRPRQISEDSHAIPIPDDGSMAGDAEKSEQKALLPDQDIIGEDTEASLKDISELQGGDVSRKSPYFQGTSLETNVITPMDVDEGEANAPNFIAYDRDAALGSEGGVNDSSEANPPETSAVGTIDEGSVPAGALPTSPASGETTPTSESPAPAAISPKGQAVGTIDEHSVPADALPTSPASGETAQTSELPAPAAISPKRQAVELEEIPHETEATLSSRLEPIGAVQSDEIVGEVSAKEDAVSMDGNQDEVYSVTEVKSDLEQGFTDEDADGELDTDVEILSITSGADIIERAGEDLYGIEVEEPAENDEVMLNPKDLVNQQNTDEGVTIGTGNEDQLSSSISTPAVVDTVEDIAIQDSHDANDISIEMSKQDESNDVEMPIAVEIPSQIKNEGVEGDAEISSQIEGDTVEGDVGKKNAEEILPVALEESDLHIQGGAENEIESFMRPVMDEVLPVTLEESDLHDQPGKEPLPPTNSEVAPSQGENVPGEGNDVIDSQRADPPILSSEADAPTLPKPVGDSHLEFVTTDVVDNDSILSTPPVPAAAVDDATTEKLPDLPDIVQIHFGEVPTIEAQEVMNSQAIETGQGIAANEKTDIMVSDDVEIPPGLPGIAASNSLATSAADVELDSPKEIPSGTTTGLIVDSSVTHSEANLTGAHLCATTPESPYPVLSRTIPNSRALPDPYPASLSTPGARSNSGYLDQAADKETKDDTLGTNNLSTDAQENSDSAGNQDRQANQLHGPDVFGPVEHQPHMSAGPIIQGHSVVAGDKSVNPIQSNEEKKVHGVSASIVEDSLTSNDASSVSHPAEKGNTSAAKTSSSNKRKRPSSTHKKKKKIKDKVPSLDSDAPVNGGESIHVKPRHAGKGKERGVAPRSTTSIVSGSSASSAARLLQPGSGTNSRASSVVSSIASDAFDRVSQPSPTIHKFTAAPLQPLIAPPSLFHAHGQKRKQLQHVPLTLAVQNPLHQARAASFSRLSDRSSPLSPTAPQVEPGQHSPATSTATATRRSHTWTSSPVPITRSHCRFHKISIPKYDDGPRIFFIVPGCSLTKEEVIEEEEIIDHGDATFEDSQRMVPNVESLGFKDYLISSLRLLVGAEIFREQEIFYLPLTGEEVVRVTPTQGHSSAMAAKSSSSAVSPASISLSSVLKRDIDSEKQGLYSNTDSESLDDDSDSDYEEKVPMKKARSLRSEKILEAPHIAPNEPPTHANPLRPAQSEPSPLIPHQSLKRPRPSTGQEIPTSAEDTRPNKKPKPHDHGMVARGDVPTLP